MLALPTELQRVDAIAFSPCGQYLAAGGVGVELWDRNFDRVWRWGWERPNIMGFKVTDLRFVTDGQYLCVLLQPHPHLAGVCGFLRVRDAKELHLPEPQKYTVAIACHSASTRIFAFVHTRIFSWHFAHSESWSDNEPSWASNVFHSTAIASSPTGLLLTHDQVADGSPRQFHLRNPTTGEISQSIASHFQHLDNLAFSHDSQYVVSRRENSLLVWPIDLLHRPPNRLVNDTKKAITDVAFHPDGRLWATASNDRIVKLWDSYTWMPLRAFDWHGGRMRSIAFSPDGCLAAAGTDQGQIVLFDVDL